MASLPLSDEELLELALRACYKAAAVLGGALEGDPKATREALVDLRDVLDEAGDPSWDDLMDWG